MNNALGSLQPVAAGGKLLDALTASRVNAIQSLLIEVFKGMNLRPGGGVIVAPNDNGVSLALDLVFLTDFTTSVVQNVYNSNTSGGMTVLDHEGQPTTLRLVELELCDGRKVRVLGSVKTG